MKKHWTLAGAAIAVVGLLAAFATPAYAFPTQTSPCSGCHSASSAVSVTASQTAIDSTTATYTISVNNPYGSNGWAVFSGSTKVAGGAGSGGEVALPVGVNYGVFGVSGNGAGTQGYAATTIKLAADPAPAPVTRTVKLRICRKHKMAIKAKLRNVTTGAVWIAKVDRKGYATFKNVSAGTYRLSASGKRFRFKTRTVVVK